MIWSGWFLWHINDCSLFKAKSFLYIYFEYIGFDLVGFYGILTIGGYLIPNLVYIYIYIYTNFVEYNRHFLSTYFLVDPFILPYWFYCIRRVLDLYIFHNCLFPKYFPTTEVRKILTENTTILEHQNNKQKLQILEALHFRKMQPKLNRINFQTSANVL